MIRNAFAIALLFALSIACANAQGAPGEFSVAPGPLPSASVPAASERVADPAAWGVYAQLLGRMFTGEDPEGGKRKFSWRWGDGDEIIQDDHGRGRSIIRPGQAQGELVMTWLEWSWAGRIADDGSVLWVGRNLLARDHRVVLVGDELREEMVKVSDGHVTKVKKSHPYRALSGEVPPAAAWGLYANLVGKKWIGRAVDNGEPVEHFLFWEVPGRVIAEEWHSLLDNRFLSKSRVELGKAPGELSLSRPNGTGSPTTWVGRMQSDGSVLFVRDAWIKSPFIVALTDRGEIVRKTPEPSAGDWQGAPYSEHGVQQLKVQYAERLARERRESSESSARFNQAMGTLNDVLNAANEVATAQQEQSRAELDATLARMGAQAKAQRQAAGQAGHVGPTEQGQQLATQQARAQATTSHPPPVSGSGPRAATTPGAPLRFILQIGLKTVIKGNNATCYSNIVTIPGPPGWPAPSKQAHGLIEPYMPGFKAKCSAIGPLANGEPAYHWNQRGHEHISPESVYEFGKSHEFPFVQL